MVNITGNNNNNNLPGTIDSDLIRGLGGNDILGGFGGNDELQGGAGNDRLAGGAGNDTLVGGAGNDILVGGGDDDVLIGGAGNNVLTGGAGNDAFKLDNVFGVNTTITDFAPGNDEIRIDRSQFFVFNAVTGAVEQLPPGTLDPGKFNVGAGPADLNDYFNYNINTGVLSFDRDGSRSGPGFPTTQIAQLSPGLVGMDNTNIVMI